MVMMVVMMVMGCNSGGVKGEGTGGGDGRGLSGAMMEVGRSAENAFYAFLELVSDVLGFTAKVDTKKSDVGNYFDSLGKKLGDASKELEEVAQKSETDTNKGDLSKNSIREAINVAKGILGTLKGHLESLKGIGDGTIVGEAATDKEGAAPADVELKKAYNALKGIVDTADKEGVEKLEVGNTAVKVGNADNKDGAKILSTDSAHKPAVADAGKAAAILTTVNGKEMLASIVKSTEGDPKLEADATAQTTAMSFAKGNTGDRLAKDVAKAAAVAGGIALRSLVKSGKLASGAGDGSAGGKEEVQAVGISAVNKLLVAVEDIIKKTVKNVLDHVKQEVDKARDPKAVGQQ
ncbi:variable large family protein [Borrelia crocidurae]